MRHLLETEIREDPARLAAAWAEEASLAIIPVRQGMEASWIADRAAQLPAELQSGCVLLTTSGSTGAPKLIVGSKARAEALARTLHTLQDSEPVQEALVVLPLSYCYAFVNQWLWAHLHGRRLIISPGLAAPDTLRAQLEHADRAMLCLVGSQVPLLLRHFAGRSFPGILRLHFAGGPFPGAHLDAVRDLFPRAHLQQLRLCRGHAAPVAQGSRPLLAREPRRSPPPRG